MSMKLTMLISLRMSIMRSNFSELEETSTTVSSTSQRLRLVSAMPKLFATVLTMLKMSLLALDQPANSRESESVSSSETLIDSDLASSLPHNSELDSTWLRSPFPHQNSSNSVIPTRHQKKELTLNGESSAIMLMKFSPRRVLRRLSILKLV